MSPRALIPGSVAVLALVLFLGWNSYRVQQAELPPRIECASQEDALMQGARYIVEHGGSLMSVLGTGSMAPYIPAARAGVDPLSVVVAWIATVPNASFANVTKGSLDVYQPAWVRGNVNVLHQAAGKSGDEWIMSGLHNAHYERGDWRMNERVFRGIAAATFTWPQEAKP